MTDMPNGTLLVRWPHTQPQVPRPLKAAAWRVSNGATCWQRRPRCADASQPTEDLLGFKSCKRIFRQVAAIHDVHSRLDPVEA